MATHAVESCLENSMAEEPGGLQSMVLQSQTDGATEHTHWCPKAWRLGLLTWMREFRALLLCHVTFPPRFFRSISLIPLAASLSQNPPVLLRHLSGKGVVGKWSLS